MTLAAIISGIIIAMGMGQVEMSIATLVKVLVSVLEIHIAEIVWMKPF